MAPSHGRKVEEKPPDADAQRLDKWLWYARVVKTRSLATKLVAEGRVRVNGERNANPAKRIRPGDVLTIALLRDVRVLRVLAPGDRRGPFSEAQTLLEDLSSSLVGGAC
jgi:ribosome-associated heat shock protein Hsp15